MQNPFNNPTGLVITGEADWNLFPKLKLDVIVDPMVFRSGQLLLRGRSGVQQVSSGSKPDEVWKALSQNIGSLAAFFDALILNEHLPIIDYGPSFDPDLSSQAIDLVQYCNQNEGILVPVHVENNAYFEAKQEAITLLAERKQLPSELVTAVWTELAAFGYEWKPFIPEAETVPTEQEKALIRFLFGGILFGLYAQRTGAAHLLQPKRSRLYLAASLGESTQDYGNEEALFAEMKRRVKQVTGTKETTYEIEALPPFLPYLLKQDPLTPIDLLRKALALRQKGAVRDYREWRTKLIREWRDYGRIDLTYEKDIKKLTRAVVHEIDPQKDHSPEGQIAMKATLVGLVPAMEIGIQREASLSALWGWFTEKLPGHRHSKLLMRMVIANYAYGKIDQHLKTLWQHS
jgi:hypothetical protein